MDKVIEKKRFSVKKIVLIVFACLFVVFTIYVFKVSSGSKLRVKKERLTISEVKKGNFQEYISFRGNVISKGSRSIVSIEGGRVEEIYCQTGVMVVKGQKILKLSNTNLLLDIMYREAELFRQTNNLRNTRLEFEKYSIQLEQQLSEIKYNLLDSESKFKRMEKLNASELVSKEEYESAANKYNYYKEKLKLTEKSKQKELVYRGKQIEQLEHSLRRMEGNLKIVRQKQEDLTIKAPIGGLLSLIEVKIGESYPQGKKLGQVDVLNSFKIRAEVDEHYISRVEVNRKGTFDYSGKTYNLICSKVYPAVTEGKFKIDLNFQGKEPISLKRGQSFYINFQLGEINDDTIILSRGAFYNKTGGNWVYVIAKDGKNAFKRVIQIGRQNPKYYEIIKGLQEGEKIITSSYDNFGDVEFLIIK